MGACLPQKITFADMEGYRKLELSPLRVTPSMNFSYQAARNCL